MMKFLPFFFAFLLLVSAAPARADICALPGPGCGDAELKFDADAIKNFATTGNPMSFLSMTACCSCSGVEKAASEVFDGHRQNFQVTKLGLEYFKKAMEIATSRLQAFQLGQSGFLGGFIDGSVTNEYLSARKSLEAQSRQSAQSSEGLCRAASLTQSLAADDSNRRNHQILFSEINLARTLGTDGSGAALGAIFDTGGRLTSFMQEYCQTEDSNNALQLFCGLDTASAFSAIDETKRRNNEDINFAKTFALKPTLNINLADEATGERDNAVKPLNNLTADEQSLIALGYNLFGHRAFAPRFSRDNVDTLEYINFRSLLAMRALTHNTFAAQAAERVKGTGGAANHMHALIKEMTASGIDPKNIIGEKPSYYAQMNLLTKDLYQNTNFYGTLMDNQANVSRQSAHLDAIDLMQKRDLYRSFQRSELLLAGLLELKIREDSQFKNLYSGLNGR